MSTHHFGQHFQQRPCHLCDPSPTGLHGFLGPGDITLSLCPTFPKSGNFLPLPKSEWSLGWFFTSSNTFVIIWLYGIPSAGLPEAGGSPAGVPV